MGVCMCVYMSMSTWISYFPKLSDIFMFIIYFIHNYIPSIEKNVWHVLVAHWILVERKNKYMSKSELVEKWIGRWNLEQEHFWIIHKIVVVRTCGNCSWRDVAVGNQAWWGESICHVPWYPLLHPFKLLCNIQRVKNKESGKEQASSDTSGVQIHKHRA